MSSKTVLGLSHFQVCHFPVLHFSVMHFQRPRVENVAGIRSHPVRYTVRHTVTLGLVLGLVISASVQ